MREIRLLTTLLLGGTATYALFWVVAMWAYPGGTWLNPGASGHDFWANFLCDLLHERALNGERNYLGSRAMLASMLVLVFVIGVHWWVLPLLFDDRPRLGWAVRMLGVISSLASAGVPLLPSDRFGALHSVVVVTAAVPGLAACVFGVAGVALGESGFRPLTWVGVSMGIAAGAATALYVRTQWFAAPLTVAVPATQKLALILVLAWLVIVALRVRRRARVEPASS